MTRIWLAGLLRRHPARLLAAALGVGDRGGAAGLPGIVPDPLTGHHDRAGGAHRGRGLADPGHPDGDVPPRWPASSPASPGVQGSSAGRVRPHQRPDGETAVPAPRTPAPAWCSGCHRVTERCFPAEIRTLVGADTGVLLAQQTAANLHAAPGDTITIGRAGLPPARAVVAGVVDLPQANSLFQTVGAPSRGATHRAAGQRGAAPRRTVASAVRSAGRCAPRPGVHPNTRSAQPRLAAQTPPRPTPR